MHTYTLQSMCDGRFTPLLACPSAMMIVPSPREPAIIAHWHEMHWMDHCRRRKPCITAVKSLPTVRDIHHLRLDRGPTAREQPTQVTSLP